MNARRPAVARAKPLLGTVVEISIGGLERAEAYRAMDKGFAAIAEIHCLMSFHEAASDVSRLNRDAAAGPVAVDPRTLAVILHAQEIAAASDGLFDITTAPALVAWGFLPRPESSPAPDPTATWRDVHLESRHRIRFAKPLWIDLGGIAKGYAVDQAMAAMALDPSVQVCVNAGGDLRVAGPAPENVRLRVPFALDVVPVVALQDGALASSSGRENARDYGGKMVGPHIRGTESVGTDAFVSVTACDCTTADALTKVALAGGAATAPIFRRFDALAYLYETRAGWHILGGDSGGGSVSDRDG